MKPKRLILAIVTVLLQSLYAPAVYAQVIEIPHVFYGTVTINGSPAPIGTQVEARGDGVVLLQGNPLITTEVGVYGSADTGGVKLIVQGNIADGAVLTFYVNGVSTGQTYAWRSQEITQLNLAVNTSTGGGSSSNGGGSSGGGGGGGGGGGAAGVTNVLDSVTETGRFTQNVAAKSDDGKVTLFISSNTIGKNLAGKMISHITAVKMQNPPAPPADTNIIGLVYDFGPDGATFNPPISITFTYDPALIPSGVAEPSLVVATWDKGTGKWVELTGCVVNPESNTITVPVSHFSSFTVLANTRPANFAPSDLSINPAEITIGKSTSVSLIVTNTGDITGSYEVKLKFDGAVNQMKQVEIGGGKNEKVTFSITPDIVGIHTIDVNGLTGKLTINSAPKTSATFTTSALNISPAEANVGETINIVVTVTNTSSAAGSQKVTLKIDYVLAETKEVTLTGGASQKVAFTVAKNTAGKYSVDCNGLAGSFEVKGMATAVPPSPQPTPSPASPAEPSPTAAIVPPSPSPSEPSVNWPVLYGVIGAVIAVGLIIFFVCRRRTY